MSFKTDISFRKEVLKKLLHSILQNEDAIIKALYADFKKPEFEAIITETHFVVSDLKDAIRNINRRAKPKRVFPSLLNFPSSDYIYSEPYGKVLIISPWNYPFQLAICPLIAAVSAGNSVVLKPSELTPNTSQLMARIIKETFSPEHVDTVLGGPEIAKELLRQRWDYIFFTGSVNVGRIVAQAAAANLTPVTLELGGKNPCIVDETSNLRLAAKRIVWGKFINAGQTCISADYIVAHDSIRLQLIAHLKEEITIAFGEDPQKSPDYARIIDAKNTTRLAGLLSDGKILFGGVVNFDENYISPTLLDEPDSDSEIMKGEIFGPLLPILSYSSYAELETKLSQREKPLALYIFTDRHSFARKIISQFSFGGGCINDTVVHFSNKRLPFGGVGNSGIGAYHGESSFDTFSHKKSIVKKGTWLDIPLRYAPYGDKISYIRKILKWF